MSISKYLVMVGWGGMGMGGEGILYNVCMYGMAIIIIVMYW